MQDILPKDEPPRPPKRLEISGDEVEVPPSREPEQRERSIRNINVTRQRPMERGPERPGIDRPGMDRREVPPVGGGLPRRDGSRSSLWLWVVAAALLAILGVLALFMFRATTVTVTPRAHTIVFDASKSFVAYPASTAQPGTLTYTVQSFDVEDSEPVTAQGTTHAERKASGTVTLVNEYSAAPVHFVKTTRFQTPAGLVFRAPEDITIPGMKGNSPGTINVTLVADQAGDSYNIGPTARFTLPGLQGGPMYNKVYARSTSPFSGGFSGDEPNISADVRAGAIAAIQTRLRDKISEQLSTLGGKDGTVFPSFATVSYQDLPATAGAEGKTNLNQRAHVEVPVLPTQDFNRLVGGTVSADAQNAQLSLNPKQDFTASLVTSSDTPAYGSTPITFSLAGTAQLVWQVDNMTLAQALAGKDQSAFQTVVNGFPGVQEARARIEPFWQHTFPSDPKKIQVIIASPQEIADQ